MVSTICSSLCVNLSFYFANVMTRYYRIACVVLVLIGFFTLGYSNELNREMEISVHKMSVFIITAFVSGLVFINQAGAREQQDDLL